MLNDQKGQHTLLSSLRIAVGQTLHKAASCCNSRHVIARVSVQEYDRGMLCTAGLRDVCARWCPVRSCPKLASG